ncbi:MAG: YidC/Oxa1 family membrane protein insertase [Candidatus Uhrbacteria bacterium]|nr:YidC/Oxa1 family membrane protein insertase [Candidatus Uhrbacteria bacterium]
MNIFYVFLFQPIFNLLVFLYNIVPGGDMGIAIILLTVIIKLALWPLMSSSLKSQKAMQELQPKLDALKIEYKDDKEGLSKAMMALYQEEKVNPLASCLPIVIQLPVLIALYRVLFHGFDATALNQLYPFIHNPGSIHTMFLGFINLGQKNIWLAILAGILQFFQTRMMIMRQPPKQVAKSEGAKDESMLASMNKSMMYMMPIMTVLIGIKLPGGLTLYWVTVTVFSIVQQWWVFNQKQKKEVVKK